MMLLLQAAPMNFDFDRRFSIPLAGWLKTHQSVWQIHTLQTNPPSSIAR